MHLSAERGCSSDTTSLFIPIDHPKHVMRNVSTFHLPAHTLAVEPSLWRSGSGHCDKCSPSCAAAQIEARVLLYCKTRVCVCVCALLERNIRLFLSLMPVFYCGGPLYILHILA